MKKLFAGCALLLAGGLHAQFPIVGTPTSWLFGLTSLTNGGPKFIERYQYDTDTIRIYNLDLTLYRNLLLPPLPPGATAQTEAFYVTEALFDTDPSTIEYLTIASGPGISFIRVCREDATILLQLMNTYINGGGGYGDTELYQHAIISTTVAGSYMSLKTDTGSIVYQLPGQLPCNECGGIAMGGDGGDAAGPGGNIMAFPNPTAGGATVQYTLPTGSTSGVLVLNDARGAVVKRVKVSGWGMLHLTTSDLSAGTYLYHLETDHGIIGPERMVVLR